MILHAFAHRLKHKQQQQQQQQQRRYLQPVTVTSTL
jgi:hypothetical protein